MGKVLIIDDENQLRGLLARIIGLEGYEVIHADSCKAGLKQVEQQNTEAARTFDRDYPADRPWEYPGWSTSDKKRCIRLYNQRRRQ